MPFCLVKPLVDNFKQALKDGRLNPFELKKMSSENRRLLFETIVGKENAPKVNAEFEKKSILRDQQKAMLDWAQQGTGSSKTIHPDLLAKIQKMKPLLTPADKSAFLEDFVATKLGTKVTFEEAKKITELSDKALKAKAAYDPMKPKGERWASKEARIEYGAASTGLRLYTESLGDPYRGLGATKTVKKMLSETGKDIANAPLQGTTRAIGNTLGGIVDNAISMMSSLDNSVVGRQGINVLKTHPKIWWRTFIQSFKDIANTVRGKDALSATEADVFSRENAMSGNYKIADIRDSSVEQFRGALVEKVPGIGRLYKAAENAFKAGSLRMRADVFDAMYDKFEKKGIDMNDRRQIESIGTITNSLVARGNLGKYDGAMMRAVFWAPRMLKAHFDVLTAHSVDYARGKITKEAYHEALKNRIIIAGVGTMIAFVAKTLDEDSVNLNPLSSDWGKVLYGPGHKQGSDISGGGAGLETLIARQIMGKTMDANGKIVKFEPGFGKKSRYTVLEDFLNNKMSPQAKVFVDLLKGEMFAGEELTVKNELYRNFTALSLQGIAETVKNPDMFKELMTLLDIFGFQGKYQPPSKKK